jgi:hypothetical protein
MPSTYEPIATNTLGSAVSTYQFTSIPSTYTDLVVIMQPALSVSNNAIYLDFNNDTATNYSFTVLSGNGSAVTTSRGSSAGLGSVANDLLYPSSTLGNTTIIMNIQNYANTTTNKTYLVRGNQADSGSQELVGLWRNSAAINAIKFYSAGSNFSIGSTFTLYGIKAA